jgi:hypothetical protein
LSQLADTISHWKDEYTITKVIPNLAIALSKIGRFNESIEMTLKMQGNSKINDALIDMLPYFDKKDKEDLIQRIQASVLQIEESYTRAKLLTRLIPYLDATHQTDAARTALSAARTIVRDGLLQNAHGDMNFAEVIAAVFPYMPQEEWPALFNEGQEAVFHSMLATTEEHLYPMAYYLSHLDSKIVYPIWRQTIRRIATGNRRRLLWNMWALIPIIKALGGDEAMRETGEVIIEVGKWFP